MAEKVVLLQAPEYQVAHLYQQIKRGLELLNFSLPRQRRVLLKPNVLAQNVPAQCATTHPALVEAVCQLLHENECAITIGESAAFYQDGYTRKAFVTSGIEEVARRYEAALVPFEEDGAQFYPNPAGKVLSQVLLTRQLQAADLVINLPKLKTHTYFRLSGTVKNLFGLVPGGAKYEYHFIGGCGQEIFGEKLVDIYQIVKPALHIMDAVVGMDGFGPGATGRPRPTGLVMLAENPFALDYVSSQLIGYPPEDIFSTSAGMARGLLIEPEQIQLLGDFATLPHVEYRKPPMGSEPPKEKNRVYQVMVVSPRINSARCDKCGHCVQVCAPGAISLAGTPAIDQDKCLKCYVCFYHCPLQAIDLKSSLLGLVVCGVRSALRL